MRIWITMLATVAALGLAPVATEPASATTGTKRVAVVPIHASAQPPTTSANVRAQIIGPGRTLEAYFDEASSGLLDIQWNVVDWYPAPYTGSGSCSQAQAAIPSALAARGINANAYDTIAYFLWPPGTCTNHAGGGTAYMDGLGLGPSEPGYPTQVGLGTTAHEIGHALLGLGHANSMDCRDAAGNPVSLLSAGGVCTPVTYGNEYDVMGRGEGRTPRHPSLPHKLKLGWIPPQNVPTVTAPGYYTFESSAQVKPNTTQGLRVKVTGSDLLLDYRQPFGTYFEGYHAGHWATEGVAVFGKRLNLAGDPAFLADATPGHGGAQDSTLRPGMSMYDPIGNITITTIAIDGERATVRISAGPPPQQTRAERSGSVVYVTGTGSVAHDIRGSVSGSDYLVHDVTGGAIAPGAGCAQVAGNPAAVRCPTAGVSKLVVTTGAGADRIEFTGAQPVALHGGPGNDTIVGGDGNDVVNGDDGVDVVRGGAGNDRVSAGSFGSDDPHGDELDDGPGNDTVIGSPGNDRFISGPGADDISGGIGVDGVDYRTRTAGVAVTLGDGNGNDGEPGEGDTVHGDVESIVGSEFADTLVGDNGDDFFFALGGNDVIEGRGGADLMHGMNGFDTASYAAHTEGVVVTIDDVADDGAPGEGDNVASDIETVAGGQGNDRLFAGPAPFGTTLIGCEGDDVLTGGVNNDRLLDQSAAICSGGGNDTVIGGAGNDTFDPGHGHDLVDGGDGDDHLTYASRTEPIQARINGRGTTPRLNKRVGEAGENDMVIRIERITGGSGRDSLSVTGSLAMTFDGGAGDDYIRGGDGDDTLLGGAGRDRITDRGGHDTINSGLGDDLVRANDEIADSVNCGQGADDRAYADAGLDTVISCETARMS